MSTVTAISPTALDPIGYLVVAWHPWTGSDMSVIQPEYIRGISTFDNAPKEASVSAIQDDAAKQSTLVGLYNQALGLRRQALHVKGINRLCRAKSERSRRRLVLAAPREISTMRVSR